MKRKNKFIAVITGDIIGYSKFGAAGRQRLQERLKHLFKTSSGLSSRPVRFEIFRGDSFQGVIQDASAALEVALWLRASLLEADPDTTRYDCRIAIGVGQADLVSESVLESDGEAFRNSGPLLDSMENEQLIAIRTPHPAANEELKVVCILADVILKRWTQVQARAIRHTLQGESQQQTAGALQVSQPAVSKSLKTAGWNAIETFIYRYKQLIQFENELI